MEQELVILIGESTEQELTPEQVIMISYRDSEHLDIFNYFNDLGYISGSYRFKCGKHYGSFSVEKMREAKPEEEDAYWLLRKAKQNKEAAQCFAYSLDIEGYLIEPMTIIQAKEILKNKTVYISAKEVSK